MNCAHEKAAPPDDQQRESTLRVHGVRLWQVFRTQKHYRSAFRQDASRSEASHNLHQEDQAVTQISFISCWSRQQQPSKILRHTH